MFIYVLITIISSLICLNYLAFTVFRRGSYLMNAVQETRNVCTPNSSGGNDSTSITIYIAVLCHFSQIILFL